MPLPADDLVASTAKNRSDYISDGVTSNIALMYILKKNGKIRNGDFSGSKLVLPITYSGLNKTDSGTSNTGLKDVGFFNNYADFDITKGASTLTNSEWEATELASYISMSLREGWQNMGEEAALDWAEQKLKNCKLETMQVMADALYGDGTDFGGNAFDGFGVLFPNDNTTGTSGGIDRATYTWWRHQTRPANGITKSNIRGLMDNIELDTRRGSEQCDYILFGRNLFQAYQDYMHDLQRITTAEEADSGFATIKDMGRLIYFDAALDPKTGYYLNSDTVEYRHPKGQWFNVGDKEQVPGGTYSYVRTYNAGQLVCRDPARNGVITDTST